MTIQLTQDIFVGGTQQLSGAQLTLDAAVEADLVTRKCATYVSRPDGGVTTPARFKRDATSGAIVGILAEDANSGIVISSAAPSDSDGRANGTIYIQTA